MDKIKAAILYYSSTGANHQLALIHQAKRATTVALWMRKDSRNNEPVAKEKFTDQLAHT